MLLRVGDLFYVGTELEAANRQLLATLGITRVLNCGTPQTRNYFPADPFLRYAAVEVWDNAQSNFAHVFLHEALPFLDESARTRQPTLVHCKTGRSKSPAILVAWLMLRGGLGVVDAFRCVGAGKVSEALLGELLLLEQAFPEDRVKVALADVGTDDIPPLAWLACEGREGAIVESLREQLVRGGGSLSWKATHRVEPFSIARTASLRLWGWDPLVLVRRAAWEAAPTLLANTCTATELYNVLEHVAPDFIAPTVQSSLAVHLLARRGEFALQLASALDGAMRASTGSTETRAAVDGAFDIVVRLIPFFELGTFCREYLSLSAARLLRAADALDVDLEMHVASRIIVSVSEASGQRLRSMVGDVSKQSQFSHGALARLTVLTPASWMESLGKGGGAAVIESAEVSAVALPPPMADAFAEARRALSPDLALLSVHGTVEMRYNDAGTTLIVPTDCACLIWAFNFQPSLSVEHLTAITAVAPSRVRSLMAKLVDKGLFLAAHEDHFAVNEGFKSKQKRIVIA